MAAGEAAATSRPGDAPADCAGRVVELTPVACRLAPPPASSASRPLSPSCAFCTGSLDTWTGVGLITVGVERHGMRLSLSHIAEDEWRFLHGRRAETFR
jgi:hypothetical protein